ncbi:sulfatase-like hydrolase/transferase [bacterium]|nr:sulfatase-like hydrolase/transferase [bacterium]
MNNRPNILFITADHLRYDTLGHTGDTVIQTPAIDRLASEAVRFTQYFVQNPVCQPSRATMMTGRYPRHHGVRWNGNSLDENEMTLVELFKHQGYSTACIGKHHLSQQRFRQSIDYMEANNIRNMAPENPFVQYVKSRGYEYKTGFALPNFRQNLGAVPQPDLPEDCHLDSYVGKKGCDYLKRLDSRNPFFLWLGFYGPHHPYIPSGRFASMYGADNVPPFQRDKDDLKKKPIEYQLYFQTENHKYRGFPHASQETFRQMKAAYYGMVSQLDWQLGLILDTLREQSLEDNTIVVFTSDHGEFLGDHGIPAKAPFLLDCMLHVPCLIRVPINAIVHRSLPQRKRGIVSDALVESVDLFPTLTRLAGLAAPEWIQGRDLTPLLTKEGEENYQNREAIYAEAVDKRCLRMREWKLIHYPGKSYGELYHLTDDPNELNNLYAELPDMREKMTLNLYRHLDATEDFKHPRYMRFTGKDPETGDEITHYHTW